MTDRVEGCGEIEANKQCDFLAVSRSVDAVVPCVEVRLRISWVDVEWLRVEYGTN